jgi:GNAT superfamily N-acetyltransferase
VESTKIRRMSRGDMDAVCEVIAQAFADNPNTLAMVRGDRPKAQRMMRESVRVAKFGRSFSHGLVAEQGDRIVGALNAALWPRCQLSTKEKVTLAPAMVRVMGTALPRALKVASVWAKHDPKESHWHIGPIGVVPALQGRGVGKALLGSFLETADGDGSIAYLETDVDRNVPLYEQFGFRVIHQEAILGVNNRFMRRDANPPSRMPLDRVPEPP